MLVVELVAELHFKGLAEWEVHAFIQVNTHFGAVLRAVLEYHVRNKQKGTSNLF